MQRPAKNEIKKIRVIDRKWRLFEFAETRMEKLVKSRWVNSCFGGFSTFETTVRRRTGGVALVDFGSKGVLAVAALWRLLTADYSLLDTT